MIQYFRKTAPDRLIVLFFLLLLMRLPLLISGLPLLTAELNWMLVGERLADGALLYRAVWDDTAPLSALVYAGLDAVFGRSQVAYQVLSLLLVFAQAMQFNSIAFRKPIYTENSTLPAFLYLVSSCLFFDFYTLSPALLSLPFLLLALRKMLAHMDQELPDSEIFSMGAYIGIAALFHIQAVLFVLLAVAGLLLLSAWQPRKVFLMLFGFGFMFACVFLFFFLYDAQEDFYYNFLASVLSFEKVRPVNLQTQALIFLPLLILLAIGMARSFAGDARLVHYQTRVQQFMFLWVITALLTTQMKAVLYQGMLLIPAVAYFGTHLFLLTRKKWLAESLCLLFVAGVGVVNVSALRRAGTEPSQLTVGPPPFAERGKKVLVIGPDKAAYRHNQSATPYLNPRLSERHLGDMDNYASVVATYKNVGTDLPDIILDQTGALKAIFNRIPPLAQRYRPHPTQKGMWVRRF